MEELRRIREEAGLSQAQLARESGVDRATINKIEQGKRSPSIATLESLARTLSVEMADFFPKAQAPLPLHDRAAGAKDAGSDKYNAAVKAAKSMYRQRRQLIVEFEDLPSDKDRREVLEGVITAYNLLNSADLSWEWTEGLLLREIMINAALHMLKYYETAPAQETAVVNLEEARARLRPTA